MSIYFDVTNACKSGKNTGMQRTTREVHAGLARLADVVPICWTPIGQRYHHLGSRELECLTTPFLHYRGPEARPGRVGEGPLDELSRFFRRRCPAPFQSGDVLLVPDSCCDRRSVVLPQQIRERGIRAVAIFHDAAALRLRHLNTRHTWRQFQRYIEALSRFDLVICISQESADDLHHFWKHFAVPAARTCIEPWPVEFPVAERHPRPSEVQDGAKILFVATLEARKNHLALLQAAEILWGRKMEFELQLVGLATNAPWTRRVLAEVRRLQGLGHRLVWRKHLDDTALHGAYRECAFTVYPSLQEGFGLPIYESLWHGKPCVCGTNGALGEAAKGGGCIGVDQTDPVALAEAIARLLHDGALRETLSRQALARSFGSWSDYSRRLLEHLRISRS